MPITGRSAMRWEPIGDGPRRIVTPASPFRATVPAMEASTRQFDFDWLVVGSGFGGSVSALRLAEKGYSRRRARVRPALRATTTSPSSTWDLRRYFWAPRAGDAGHLPPDHLQGRLRRQRLRRRRRQPRLREHALRAARRAFFEDPQWADLEDWEAALAPHYAEAQRMLGVVVHEHDDPADQLLRELGEELGVGDTYRKTPVGVYFGEPGQDRRPTRSSAARGPTAPAACSAAAAWSAARTAPRTRSSRTTSGWPSSAARR